MRELLANALPGSLDAPIAKTLLAGDAVWLPVANANEVRSAFPTELWPFLERFGIASLLMVPLCVRGQVIGGLSLGRSKADRPYTEFDKVLVQDLADRAAFAIENARLYQSVSEKREQLRALSAKLVEAQEAERRTIARELHNEIGQALTGLQISLKLADRLSPEAARVKLEEAQSLVEQLLDRVQNLSLDLRPAVLDDLGLAPALLWHFERYTQQTGIRVRFDHRGIGRRFAPEIETAVYRIIQEGLTNVARHAHVAEAAVHIWTDDGSLGLQVEDEGTGFDVRAVLAAHRSSGLSGLQEQAELLGGELTIESTPGAGTVITVELPLPHSLNEGQAKHAGEDSAGG
jgi:signal transduction histidine kinase